MAWCSFGGVLGVQGGNLEGEVSMEGVGEEEEDLEEAEAMAAALQRTVNPNPNRAVAHC